MLSSPVALEGHFWCLFPSPELMSSPDGLFCSGQLQDGGVSWIIPRAAVHRSGTASDLGLRMPGCSTRQLLRNSILKGLYTGKEAHSHPFLFSSPDWQELLAKAASPMPHDLEGNRHQAARDEAEFVP